MKKEIKYTIHIMMVIALFYAMSYFMFKIYYLAVDRVIPYWVAFPTVILVAPFSYFLIYLWING